MARTRLTEDGWVVEEGPEDRPRPEQGDHLRQRAATQDAAAIGRIAELEADVKRATGQAQAFSEDIQRLADFILANYPDVATLHFDQVVDVAITLLAPVQANTTEAIDDATAAANTDSAAGDGTDQPGAGAEPGNAPGRRSRK